MVTFITIRGGKVSIRGESNAVEIFTIVNYLHLELHNFFIITVCIILQRILTYYTNIPITILLLLCSLNCVLLLLLLRVILLL